MYYNNHFYVWNIDKSEIILATLNTYGVTQFSFEISAFKIQMSLFLDNYKYYSDLRSTIV